MHRSDLSPTFNSTTHDAPSACALAPTERRADTEYGAYLKSITLCLQLTNLAGGWRMI